MKKISAYKITYSSLTHSLTPSRLNELKTNPSQIINSGLKQFGKVIYPTNFPIFVLFDLFRNLK